MNTDRFYSRMASAVRAEREKRGLSVNNLAIGVGVQYNTIKGIESGRPFHADHMVWMVNFLNIDINQLILGGNNGKENSGKKAEVKADTKTNRISNLI